MTAEDYILAMHQLHQGAQMGVHDAVRWGGGGMSPIHTLGWACIAVGALLLFSHLCDAVILQITGSCSGQGTHIFSVVGANVTGNCLNWTIEGGI